jgi:hypothetical protein
VVQNSGEFLNDLKERGNRKFAPNPTARNRRRKKKADKKKGSDRKK